MRKNYKEVDWRGGSLEKCVEMLLLHKDKGELVFYSFNGHLLYSDTVTLDDAFLKVTNMTKADFDKEQQRKMEQYRKEKEQHEASIPKLTKYWRDRGRKVLTEDKWEHWDEIVPIRLKDLYHGMELRCCLEIIEILNDGTFQKAKEAIYEQGHSGMSFGLVCTMIRTFHPKGVEFTAYIA